MWLVCDLYAGDLINTHVTAPGKIWTSLTVLAPSEFRPRPIEDGIFFELGFQIVEVLLGFLVEMGGGNGQKAKMAREKNVEKLKAQKGEFSL